MVDIITMMSDGSVCDLGRQVSPTEKSPTKIINTAVQSQTMIAPGISQ